ncbi:MAG TPA: phosphotransferase family protein, partial [Mycobacterium sp.]
MTATRSDTLTDTAVRALDRWLREREIGSGLSDVEPLTGGTQNIVVRLTVDGRTLVLRRPP